jgi:hypothetical protein
VSEPIGNGVSVDGRARTIHFTLREDLRAIPAGPVCFFIQLHNRRPLPVRRADRADSDTAGFRYAPWEERIRQRAAFKVAQQRVALAQQALADANHNAARQQEVAAARGWRDIGSCAAADGPAPEAGLAPYDVVAPDQHDDIARRVCVYRVWRGARFMESIEGELRTRVAKLAQDGDRAGAIGLLSGLYTDAFMLPEIAGPLLDDVLAARGADRGTLEIRMRQAAEFRHDWDRLSPTMAGYRPHVGGTRDDLSLPPTAHAIAFRVAGPELARRLGAGWAVDQLPPVGQTDKEALVGAALDAYSGCVEDGRKQLMTKWNAWQAAKSSAPRRARAQREFFARECRVAFEALEQFQVERTKMEAQLAREQQNLRDRSIVAPLPGGPLVLNGSTCEAGERIDRGRPPPR